MSCGVRRDSLILKILSIFTLMLCISTQIAAKEALRDGYYPEYPPVKLSQDEWRNAKIKRGEYLAKISDCLACHTDTERNTPAFAGGLPILTPFGTFYTPNITPDLKTGIGAWTEDDFVHALKDGRDPEGRNYFPVFPFVYFANITDSDARDMYAYFTSI